MSINLNIPSSIQKDETNAVDFTADMLLSTDGTKVTQTNPSQFVKKIDSHVFDVETTQRLAYPKYSYLGSTRTVGSGGTYATISAAIAACTSGDILQLANGTYNSASETGGYLFLNDATKSFIIQGNATDNTACIISQTSVASYCLRIDKAVNVTFKNLTIQSNQANQTIRLRLDFGANVVFENCKIIHTGTTSLATVNYNGTLLANGSTSFVNCEIIQNSNVASRCFDGAVITDTEQASFDFPLIIQNCKIRGVLAMNYAQELYCYNSYFSHNKNQVLIQIGQDTSTPNANYDDLTCDIRSCYFTYDSGFGSHAILLGRGTTRLIVQNNVIELLPTNDSLHIGVVVKTIATTIGNSIISGNKITAPRPIYIKGGLYNVIRNNTGICNSTSVVFGSAFEINNPTNSGVPINSYYNQISNNTFYSLISAISATTTTSVDGLTTLKRNAFDSNKYYVPPGKDYILEGAISWSDRFSYIFSDVNSSFTYLV